MDKIFIGVLSLSNKNISLARTNYSTVTITGVEIATWITGRYFNRKTFSKYISQYEYKTVVRLSYFVLEIAMLMILCFYYLRPVLDFRGIADLDFQGQI